MTTNVWRKKDCSSLPTSSLSPATLFSLKITIPHNENKFSLKIHCLCLWRLQGNSYGTKDGIRENMKPKEAYRYSTHIEGSEGIKVKKNEHGFGDNERRRRNEVDFCFGDVVAFCMWQGFSFIHFLHGALILIKVICEL
jgi:hypothetical protein